MPKPVREIVGAFIRHDQMAIAAQLAYFAILSLFPCVMFLLTVIGYLPLRGLDERLIQSFYLVLPVEVAQLVDATLREIVGHQRGWLLVSTLAFALWSASDATSGLITALNRAHQVEETRAGWRVKLRAFVVTIGCGVALFIATVAVLVGPELVHRGLTLLGLGGAFEEVWAVARWPLALLLLTMVLASVYHFLPNLKQRWRVFSPGAAVAVVGWLLLSLGFKLYVSHFSSYAKTYGALGTAMLLLIWLHLSAVMVLLGGEINACVRRRDD